MSTCEALEFEIESFWLKLCKRRRRAAVRVWLSPTGKLSGVDGYETRGYAALVGYYDHNVTLADLRADVFHEFERMRR